MPKSLGHRKRHTQVQRFSIVRRFSASGLSVREFCRREGLALSNLQRWRAEAGAEPPRGGFVELSPPSAGAACPSGWTVELTLPNGVSLRLQG